MLRITCPHCGERPVDEYRFGGAASHVPDSVTDPDARNVDHVWFHDNVEGPSTERWFHLAGCRRWLTLRRDAVTDTVLDPLGGGGARGGGGALGGDDPAR